MQRLSAALTLTAHIAYERGVEVRRLADVSADTIHDATGQLLKIVVSGEPRSVAKLVISIQRLLAELRQFRVSRRRVNPFAIT